MFIGRHRSPAARETHAAPQIAKLLAVNGPTPAFQDNRAIMERIKSLQSVIQQGTKRNHITRNKHWQTESAQNWLDKNALPVLHAWPVLEVTEYLKRNHLQRKRTRQIKETTIFTLSDDSAIFVYGDLFWRHESASHASVFFDSSHVQCPDLTKTHFLTKKGCEAFA
ncbi:MAG: hypothetical protein MI746_09800 [Pseudomonadales bacterium]|nr:hypothetical protein [Pseudomonadales bacterium]